MKLPIMSSRQLCRFLEKEGFVLIRQKGSHKYYRDSEGTSTVVPYHANKTIGRGLLLAILDEIEIDRKDFIRKFKRTR